MKYQFVTNAIQLQLYHYQLYTHQHATKMILIDEHMVPNENSFRKGSLEVKE
jgi:hypothetical protein